MRSVQSGVRALFAELAELGTAAFAMKSRYPNKSRKDGALNFEPGRRRVTSATSSAHNLFTVPCGPFLYTETA